ncbi:TolC family protein [Cyclobacterium marinum]|uniref:Outer membrane efflux protein n=1 Tax=Cyclobacterium marinum (strain ATCC 25205 / DSM 745 / LMG 13164 / NCIMB 1802) TaxID=880070 RepID=G0IZ11_CYCMS|nr:TolC family protein [Cyclobacterium marinum]AEL28156.1 outer membrane efflux protein [Cyclobacterium marinum DSM 745]MBI0397923.1 TolC family protein [Cyclobacterium marinum]MBR9776559.1 TolC family protein [Cytophagales bacterium]|tara:strand:- start:19776 stop:21161 length:1386 start_codon:yes stop_codon:yes gene_type:complete
MCIKKITSLILFLSGSIGCFAQDLSLVDAIDIGIQNYGAIKSKVKYASASEETLKQARLEYLPDINISAQQTYGTVNGQYGSFYGMIGNAAASGPSLTEQNWNAAFGAQYLSNVNWDFYTFGKVKQKINLEKINVGLKEQDLEQEKFELKIKITSAYLNLLASQRMVISQQKNLERAKVFLTTATARVKNGLQAGVDSTMATAEVSKAKIALNQARFQVKEFNNRLIDLMGVSSLDFTADTLFVSQIPKQLLIDIDGVHETHPSLKFLQTKVDFSNQQVKLSKRFYYPSMSIFGVFQSRASGFNSNYSQDQNAFTKNYWDGVQPSRSNYLFGASISWNLSTPFRIKKQVKAQEFIAEGVQEEYNQLEREIQSQLKLADEQIKIAMENYSEAPVQVKAAAQAYRQKMTLYQNGLTTLTDLTQALYLLNRAEIDRDIVNTNVWQSYLVKVAAIGDFELFIKEF